MFLILGIASPAIVGPYTTTPLIPPNCCNNAKCNATIVVILFIGLIYFTYP
jgi:hypothetical protein